MKDSNFICPFGIMNIKKKEVKINENLIYNYMYSYKTILK
jgi:hypothetical protein